MMMIWSQPAAMASSTPYWMMGLSTSGSISLGCALVAGRNRVPNPAAGKTALRTLIFIRIPALRLATDKRDTLPHGQECDSKSKTHDSVVSKTVPAMSDREPDLRVHGLRTSHLALRTVTRRQAFLP